MSEKIFEMIKKEGIKMIDLRFVDIFGQWQHFTSPVEHFKPDDFKFYKK